MGGRSLVLLALALLSTGCATTPPDRWTWARPVSESAAKSYWEARRNLETIDRFAAGPCPGERAALVDEGVLPLLDAAMQTSPWCPLFEDQWGAVLLTLGGEYADEATWAEAERRFTRALELAPPDDRGSGRASDWVPGWIGLARIEIERADLDAARTHLDQADAAIDRLEHAHRKGPNADRKLSFVDGLLGISSLPVADEGDDVERLNRLLFWIRETENRSLDARPLPRIEEAETLRLEIDPDDLFARLKARVRLERALAAHAETADDEALRVALVRILDEEDPDFFPAHHLLSRLDRRAGRPREAVVWLDAYLNRPIHRLKMAESPLVWLDLARANADAYAATGELRYRDDAIVAIERAKAVSPTDARVLAEEARLHARIARLEDSADAMAFARLRLREAEAGRCTDASLLEAARLEIEGDAQAMGR